ncbi:MAG: dTMP kinase [Minisyncoccia bacterium]
MKKKGKLIVLDGSDGSGKTTQIALLIAQLRHDGYRVKTTNFPNDNNFFGKLIRKSLAGKHGDFIKIDPYIVSSLYAADRFESKDKIEKWLSEGAVVILDRYVSANQMHQGGKIKDAQKRKEFLKWLDIMEHAVFGIPRPDLILYLHVPVKISLTLIKKRARATDMAEKDAKHLENTQKSALRLIQAQGNWKKIDCTDGKSILSREDIHAKIYKVVQDFVGV